jgi:uncharacterized repeat protein (TIGR04138 family)
MHTANFDEALDQIVLKDPRFHRDAYMFIREALDHTQRMVNKGSKSEKGEKSESRQLSGDEPAEGKVRHVTGQELLGGVRAYALDQYGPMTLTVLNEWGVRQCEDFGELVFNMVENHLLAKTKNDSREDFKGGYDFTEAFRHPFLPSAKAASADAEPKPTLS